MFVLYEITYEWLQADETSFNILRETCYLSQRLKSLELVL